MRPPHKHGTGAYEEPFPEREMPQKEISLIYQGYKFLGWNPTADIPEYRHCINEAHNYHSVPNTWDSVQHTPSGDDCTYWCMKDRVYWKRDMSKEGL